MKHFVQLKDDVVFAFHSSSTEIDIPGDNIIEVQEDGEKFVNKKYVNGEFIDAPVIKYAVMNGNTVERIDSTIFSSEVKGIIVDSNDIQPLWTWDGTSFSAPTVNFVDLIIAPEWEEIIPPEPPAPIDPPSNE